MGCCKQTNLIEVIVLGNAVYRRASRGLEHDEQRCCAGGVRGNPERLHVCHAWVLMWPVRQGGTEYLTWFVVLRAIAMSRGTENILVGCQS